MSLHSVYSQTSFKYINGFPAIFDSINNISYSFDSGASTFISTDSKIGKKAFGFSIIKDVNNKIKFKRKQKLMFDLSGFGTLNTKALNIGKINECLKIDVFLGIETFEYKILFFDFNKQEFEVLEDLSSLDYSNFDQIPLNFDSYNYRYKIKANIGNDKVSFLLDLGYNGEVLIKNKNDITFKADVVTDVAFFGANSNTISTIEKFNNLDLLFSNNTKLMCDITYANKAKYNLIGIGFFRKYEKVIFDFKKKLIYLSKEKNKCFYSEEEIDFCLTNSKILISKINHNNLLYKNGFRVGNTIQLNDKALESEIFDSPCEINILIEKWKKDNPNKPLF
nr:hypothetical protein [uncultured Flavobacterium sp.]